MRDDWKKLEGHVVNKMFPLRKFFGARGRIALRDCTMARCCPKNFRSGNILLTTWPSSFFQSSLIGHPWARFDGSGRVKSPAEGAGAGLTDSRTKSQKEH